MSQILELIALKRCRWNSANRTSENTDVKFVRRPDYIVCHHALCVLVSLFVCRRRQQTLNGYAQT